MKTLTSVFVSLLLMSALAAGQATKSAPGGDEAALRAIEDKWDAANLKGDAAALAAIFADTFVSTSSEGQLRTKAEVLARVKSGEVKYQSAKSDDVKVIIYGDAAVVTGRWNGKYVEKGKSVSAAERYTDTFIRQNGQWRCVASHGSTIK